MNDTRERLLKLALDLVAELRSSNWEGSTVREVAAELQTIMNEGEDDESYKVWIEIEHFNEKTTTGQTLDAPGASVTSFKTYDEARAFAARLQAIGEVLADGNPEHRLVYP